MTRDEFHAGALALPGATMDVQCGDDHIYKVGGKMFAGVAEEARDWLKTAHELVAGKLTRAQKKELGLTA